MKQDFKKTFDRQGNRCKFYKPVGGFDVSKYTCRECTAAKDSYPYSFMVRFDRIGAHRNDIRMYTFLEALVKIQTCGLSVISL